MRHRTFTARLAGGLLAAALLAVSAGAALADNVLRIAREQDSTTFDPIFTILAPDVWVLNQFYSTLVRANADATDIVPDLAESWEIAPDGLTYTFHLRDAKFSDGTEVKASDVAFSLARVRDEEASPMRSLYQVISAIETPDDRTVVLKLERPYTPLMSALAMFAASIVPEHAVKEHGEAFGENPVGSGAFVLKEWRRGDRVVLERNPHYWEAGLPKLDGIEWIYVPNDNTRMLKLTAGEVEAATFVPWNQIKDLQGDSNIKVQLDKSTRMDHILVNHDHAPLDNKNVRQALNMAIDQQAIVDVVTFGYGTPANSFFPLDGMYYNPDNPRYPYDPEKAKAILEAEGVDGLSLDFVLVSGDSAHDQIGVLVKDQLAKVGVDVNIVKMEGGQQWDALIAGEYDIGVMWWVNDIFDPDQKAQFCVSGDPENRSYYTNYKNPKVTELVTAAAVELDPAKRKEMYYEIQRLAKDDVHWIDLYYSPFRNASRANVHGFVQNPLGRYMLETAYIE
ncbi:MAG: diguanylate cyclase [Alphaproteobacteria bacterium]|nr:MAG: diguanylate cyclase [Alphaproteobacteria bacterium]